MIMKRKKREYTPEEIEKAKKAGRKGDRALRSKYTPEEYTEMKKAAGLKGLAKRYSL